MKILKHMFSSKNKYNAKSTEIDGIKFASQKEARRYVELKALQEKGDVVMFLRQVPFHLIGSTKYVVDFLVFWASGTVTVEDVKGFKNAAYLKNKKQTEVKYPIEITEI